MKRDLGEPWTELRYCCDIHDFAALRAWELAGKITLTVPVAELAFQAQCGETAVLLVLPRAMAVLVLQPHTPILPGCALGSMVEHMSPSRLLLGAVGTLAL